MSDLNHLINMNITINEHDVCNRCSSHASANCKLDWRLVFDAWIFCDVVDLVVRMRHDY